MSEWSSPYNPFNSLGCLVFSKQFEAIAKQDFLPPVMVDIDVSNLCNLNCYWCNSLTIRKKSQDLISTSHLLKIADFIKEWGCISACVAGGGEPMMNPGFVDLLYRLHDNGIKIGVITNGTLMGKKEIRAIAETCRWCGISVDAGTASTYSKQKVRSGVEDFIFNTVINNIQSLVRYVNKINSNCSVGFKYLLNPINAHEIYLACKLAKDLGVHDFHLRPVGSENIEAFKDKEPLNYTDVMPIIKQHISEIRDLEDNNFKVYSVSHKFTNDFKKKVNFSRCWALPLLPTFGADGNCHLCFDIRGRDDLIMCRHNPNPEEILKFWNTDKHKKMIADIDITKCPRCTFSAYNEIVEKVFIDDGMCRDFV